MNKSAIEWTDFTWNPVTGCLHSCSYCYARGIARRFQPESTAYNMTPEVWYGGEMAFPRGFAPTFYPERLSEPLSRKKPATIFVCSMADLFGKWVPFGWIEAVLETVYQAPQHTFIFLTKNPERYEATALHFPKNVLLGATATDQESWDRAIRAFTHGRRFIQRLKRRQLFISAEPLLGSITPTEQDLKCIQWLIIGANSNRGAEKPRPAWGMDLIDAAQAAGVPVFVKKNWPWISPPWPQEFPLRGEAR